MTDYLNAVWHPSPNHESRRGLPVLGIVDHITAGDGKAALDWLCSSASRVSAHYLVTRAGYVYQLVDEAQAAWHAGVDFSRGYAAYRSDRAAALVNWCWNTQTNPNAVTVGIEHEGESGDNLTAVQYAATLALHRHLVEAYGIPLDSGHILYHSQIDVVTRAGCPGSGFPRAALLADLAEARVPALASPAPGNLTDSIRGDLDELWALAEANHAAIIRIKQRIGYGD